MSRRPALPRKKALQASEAQIELCVYCGELATEKDHVRPVARIKGNRRRIQGEPGWQVPCCQECNSILGSQDFPNPQDRCRYVAFILSHRYGPKPRKGTKAQLRISYARSAHLVRYCQRCRLGFRPIRHNQVFCRTHRTLAGLTSREAIKTLRAQEYGKEEVILRDLKPTPSTQGACIVCGGSFFKTKPWYDTCMACIPK